MARVDPELPLMPSVLDRLIEENGDSGLVRARRRGQTVAQVRAALRRDLEDLLNTHERALTPPKDLQAVRRSLVEYGIPDLATVGLSSPQQIDQFRKALEAEIALFEPRLRNISVKMVQSKNDVDHTLRFRIEAMMYVHPDTEPLVFHSFMEPATRRFTVVSADR